MVFDQDDWVGGEDVIAIPDTVPRFFRAQACSSDGFVFDQFDCAPTFSYGKSTELQRRKLFAEHADGSAEKVSHTSFDRSARQTPYF